MRRGTGRRQATAKDRAAEVVRQDRRAKVLELTVDGKPLRAIGQLLGISHVQAKRDLDQALDDRGSDTKERARALAKERIETIIEANMPGAKGKYAGSPELAEFAPTSVECSKVVLSAIALDAKIQGYESPADVNVAVNAALSIHVTAEVARAFEAPVVEEPKLPPHLNGAGTH